MIALCGYRPTTWIYNVSVVICRADDITILLYERHCSLVSARFGGVTPTDLTLAPVSKAHRTTHIDSMERSEGLNDTFGSSLSRPRGM
jgi:hypothetical protein